MCLKRQSRNAPFSSLLNVRSVAIHSDRMTIPPRPLLINQAPLFFLFFFRILVLFPKLILDSALVLFALRWSVVYCSAFLAMFRTVIEIRNQIIRQFRDFFTAFILPQRVKQRINFGLREVCAEFNSMICKCGIGHFVTLSFRLVFRFRLPSMRQANLQE